jgi:pantoate--beta-alanine ligase
MLLKIDTVAALKTYVESQKAKGKTIGFVPTMGALHKGHISLIEQARANDIVICSVFVNPTQFNNASDLAKYPRTIDSDMLLLKEQCDVLFAPDVKEMYPEGNNLLELDLECLDKVMEGVFRPGHFQGMVTVVYNLLKMVNPDKAYFGEKDFQQLAIVKFMVNQLALPVQVIGCATIRESDGLAMSSRNIHLTDDERIQATVIYNTIKQCAQLKASKTPEELRTWVQQQIEQTGIFKLEYVAFVNATTLQELTTWLTNQPQRVCIAVITSKTRLIDNVEL